MMIMEKYFGRVQDLWFLDMGLGSIKPHFRAIRQSEVDLLAMEEEVDDPNAVENEEAGGLWELTCQIITRVIAYKTAIEIWDALETQCQGTTSIKKNIRAVLFQEYEHFEAKTDESLTDIYDRFLTLLNDLSLVEKVYDL
ncbi:hypothetical protein AgCh_004871 [Apium graveolens]